MQNLIDKIKSLAEASKGFILWVLTPLSLLVLGIVYLITKNNSLQKELNTIQSDNKINADKGDVDEKDKQANSSLDAYRNARKSYLGDSSKE